MCWDAIYAASYSSTLQQKASGTCSAQQLMGQTPGKPGAAWGAQRPVGLWTPVTLGTAERSGARR